MSNKFHEAMDELHASDDTYERVMERVHGRPTKRRGHAWPMSAAAAVAMVGVLATGGVAYAGVSSGFFQDAFGGNGLGSVSSQTSDGITTYITEHDATAVSADLEKMVQHVGLSTTLMGYTLVVEDMVIDENGAGMASYTLSNPDGLGIDHEFTGNGRNELILNENTDVALVEMTDLSGEFFDTKAIYDLDSATETEVKGTLFFVQPEGFNPKSDSLKWVLVGRNIGDPNSETEPLLPGKVVEAAKFSDDAGFSASLSPFSLSFKDGNSDEEITYSKLSLHLSDGNEQDIAADKKDDTVVYNENIEFVMSDGRCTVVMSKLVDIDEVNGIRIVGNHLTDWEDEDDPEPSVYDLERSE